MELKFVEIGTNLTIEPQAADNELRQKYTANFHEMAGATSFWAESREIFRDFDSLPGQKYLDLSFFRNANIYKFKGKIEGLLEKNGKFLIKINQLSAIEVSTRRQSARHEIFLHVRVYIASEQSLWEPGAIGPDDELLMTAQLFDLSSDGLCVLSNKSVDLSDKMYLLEFTLTGNQSFILPSRLVRRGNSRQSVQFKHDYGFLFDFTRKPEEKQRLITAIFNHKLSSVSDLKRR